jgi:MFS family permease
MPHRAPACYRKASLTPFFAQHWSPVPGLIAFLRLNGRLILFGYLMCLWSSFGQTFFISLFNTELRSTFGLSHGDIGSMYAMGTIASAVTLMLAGRLVDRFHLMAVTTFVFVGLAAAALAMGLVWSALALPFVFYGLRLFGQGLASHTGMTAMGRYFDAARGRAIALASLGYSTGEATLPAITVAALALLPWREVWFVAAGVSLIGLLFAMLLLKGAATRDKPSDASATAGATGRQYRLGEVLAELSFWLRLPTLMAPAFIVTGVFFHQLRLAEEKHWPLPLMAVSFTAFAAVSFLSVLVSGPLVDRISARRLLPFVLLPLMGSCLVLATLAGPLAAPGFMMLIGLTTGAYTIAGTAIWPELYGIRNLGAIKAFAQAAMVLASGLSPVLFGVLLDRGVAFAGLALGSAIFCAVASVLAGLANRLGSPA